MSKYGTIGLTQYPEISINIDLDTATKVDNCYVYKITDSCMPNEILVGKKNAPKRPYQHVAINEVNNIFVYCPETEKFVIDLGFGKLITR